LPPVEPLDPDFAWVGEHEAAAPSSKAATHAKHERIP
jgi:hypothetical protein